MESTTSTTQVGAAPTDERVPTGPPGGSSGLVNPLSRLVSWLLRLLALFTHWIDRVRAYFSEFFRSIGLAVIAVTNKDEKPKVVVSSSWKKALARCGVHILPSLSTLTIVTVNVTGLYIGSELAGAQNQDGLKIGVLQACAKAQELLIVGSISTMIFHALRSHLLKYGGIPLGLLSSGFSFSQVSYFWSTDFLGAVGHIPSPRLQRAGFIALLVVGGLMAVLTGPATAVLMIPRQMDWPMGGVVVHMNGSKEEIWPSALRSSSLGDYQCESGRSMLYDPNCPSGGYPSLSDHLETWSRGPARGLGDVDILDRGLRKNAQYRMREPGIFGETWTVMAHGTPAHTHMAARGLWIGAIQNLFGMERWPKVSWSWLSNYPREQMFMTEAEMPAARCACGDTTTISLDDDPDNQVTVMYPTLPDHDVTRYYFTVELGDGQKAALRRRVEDAGEIRGSPVLAVPMMIDSGDIGLAMTILRPEMREEDNGTTTFTNNWVARGCTMSAYWVTATMESDFLVYGTLYDFENDQQTSRVEIEIDTSLWGWASFYPPDNGKWRTIDIDSSWFELAAPKMADVGFPSPYDLPGNSTTLESLITSLDRMNLTDVDTTLVSEHIMATLLADSISRVANHRTSNYSMLLEPQVSEAWTPSSIRKFIRRGKPATTIEFPGNHSGTTTIEVQAILRGFVMAAVEGFDYFSITLLLLHAFMALVFSCWAIFWRPATSDAWDTITQMIVLAQTSPPPEEDLLDNTCAGVREWKTVKSLTWIEESSADADSGSGTGATVAPKEQLRLRIAPAGERRDPSRRCLPDKAYGKLEAGPKDEHESGSV